MTEKDWKHVLLSSGLPLEYSVNRVFQELGAWRPREFKYERKDDSGAQRIFSVDIHASKIDSVRNIWLETLVECKYRHQGTKWVFSPLEYETMFGPDFDDLFVTLDQCCKDRKFNTGFLASFRHFYPLCGKGMELLPADRNPKSIEQAVQQLRYAVVAKAIDCIQLQVNGLLGERTPLFVTVPVIVTTAEMWCLKPDASVESIKAASDIADVAIQKDVVVLAQEPSSLDIATTVELFEKSLNYSYNSNLDKTLKSASNIGAREFVQSFASRRPSLFVVINYSRFKSAMKRLHGFFEQKKAVSARGSAG